MKSESLFPPAINSVPNPTTEPTVAPIAAVNKFQAPPTKLLIAPPRPSTSLAASPDFSPRASTASADSLSILPLLLFCWPGPPPIFLPPMAFRSSLKVDSDAALVATTSPMPGISILTSAIS